MNKLIEPIIGGKTPDHLIIAVDFDGTICQHPGADFPAIGDPVPHALVVLKRIQHAGHKLILWTMRSTGHALMAEQYLYDEGIHCWGLNHNPEQESWSGSPKAYAHLYIDDAALGCPLVRPDNGRAYVDWLAVEDYLEKIEVLPDSSAERRSYLIEYSVGNRSAEMEIDMGGRNLEEALLRLKYEYLPSVINVWAVDGKPYQELTAQEGGQPA